MKPDTLFGLFVARLERLGAEIESEEAIRAFMAYCIHAKDKDLNKLLADGQAQEILLPKDEDGYFKMLNDWDGIPAILQAAKKAGELDPLDARELGKSALHDRFVFNELQEAKAKHQKSRSKQ